MLAFETAIVLGQITGMRTIRDDKRAENDQMELRRAGRSG